METVYRETFKPTWDLLGHLGIHRREDREDIAQSIYVVLAGKLDTYDPSLRLQAWVNGYAVNIARRYKQLARNHREQLLGDDAGEPMDTDGANPEQHAIDEDRRTILDRLIDTLEEDRRLVLVMKELQHLEMLDVARALGIPVATGWTRLRLARADLEAAIRRLGARERDALGVAGMAVVPVGASDLDRLFGDARQAPTPGAPDSGTAARIWSRLQERRPSTTLDGSLPLSAPLGSPAAPAARTLAVVFATGVGLGAAALFALLPLADPAPQRTTPSARAEVVIVAPLATTATTKSSADALGANSAASPPTTSAAPSLSSAPTDADEGDGRGATEGALIQRASAALAAGRSGEAIKLAQSHAKKYPRGRMGQERDVILIQALVLAGQHERAVELADRFRRASPASPFLPTIDAAIGAKPSP
jgi:RNA polymerase sigma factor (sigma-70 family)